MRVLGLVLLSALVGWSEAEARPTLQDRLILAAEKYLGREYVLGGRDGRRGCLEDGKRVRCPAGVDCQSLIFFAYQKVFRRAWTRFSVMPSVSIRRQELGRPVPKLDGVLRAEVDLGLLQKGDVLFFLLKGYNLSADPPPLTRGEDGYGVWHTALVHRVEEGPAGRTVYVIHAKPGDRVVIEPLADISFDGLFVIRWPKR